LKRRRTSIDFLCFMDDVVAAFPERNLHVVLDNLNIHKNQAADRWLQRHPQVHFHHTPPLSSSPINISLLGDVEDWSSATISSLGRGNTSSGAGPWHLKAASACKTLTYSAIT
ncbi:MAG: transposase, partial [Acidobacteria bacterium]|nr:transposase [Acidobacteriota bacterium]